MEKLLKGLLRSGDKDPQRPWGTPDAEPKTSETQPEAPPQVAAVNRMRNVRPAPARQAPMPETTAPEERPPAVRPAPKRARREATPAAAAVVVTKPTPAPQAKPDPYAEIRADLLANAKADAAAKAAAERKRKEAEEFSSKLKSTTRKGGSKTGYDAYKSLMGE